MADNYKGITIEFNGDTSKLSKALNDVEKHSRETNKSLREIENSLKFNPGNVDLLAQQQRKLKDAIVDTKEKLSILKEADKQAKQQLSDGKMSQAAYDSLRREILKTENQLERFEQKLSTSAKASDELNRALDKVAQESTKTKKELSEIEKALKFNPGNAELVAQQQSKLKEAIGQTGDKLDLLKEKDRQAKEQLANGELGQEEYAKLQRAIINTEKEYSNLNRALQTSEEEQSKLQKATIELQNKLSESGKSIDGLAGSMGQDFVDAFKRGEGSSKDVEKALAELEGQTNKNVEGNKDLGASFQGLEALAEVFGRIKDAAKQAFDAIGQAWVEIDDSLDTIVKKTGESGDALDDMNQQFTDIYSSMPVNAQSVGDAIGEVNTQFGLQGDELEDLSRTFLQYAEINGGDVTNATQQARAAMDQFGLSGKDVGSMLDVVTKAGQDTGVSVDKLFGAVTKGAPVLRDMGLSFEESVVLMSQFEQSGIDSSKALGFLARAQVQAAKESKSITAVLADFGKTAAGSKDDVDAITAAANLFGTRGGPMMLKATKDGKLNFEGLSAAASNAAGAVANTYEATIDPADKFTEAQNNLKIAMSDVGSVAQEALAPAIGGLASLIRDAVTWFTGLDDGVKKTILTVAGIVAVVISVISTIAAVQAAISIATPIIVGLGGAFTAVGTAIGAAGAFVAANPIVLIIAAIVAAIVLLIMHWDKVKEAAVAVWNKIVEVWDAIVAYLQPILEFIGQFFSDSWNAIRDTAVAIWGGIRDFFVSIWDGIKNTISTVVNAISEVLSSAWNAISSTVTTVWNGIKSIILGVWELIKAGVTLYINTVKTIITTVFNVIKTVVTTVWNTIKSIITGVWDGIKSSVTTAVNAVKNTVTSVFNGIKNTVTSIWNGIRDAIKSPIETAKNIVKNAIDAIKGFFNFRFQWPSIPLPHFYVSPPGWKIGDLLKGSFPSLGISWYAQGGIFDKPTIAGIGESGSEAVLPTHKLDKFLEEAINRIEKKSNGQSVASPVIYISNMVVREEADIDRIAESLKRKLDREKRGLSHA